MAAWAAESNISAAPFVVSCPEANLFDEELDGQTVGGMGTTLW